MIWSTMKGAFMLQSSEIFVASGLLFPPSYILLAEIRIDETLQQYNMINFYIVIIRFTMCCLIPIIYQIPYV